MEPGHAAEDGEGYPRQRIGRAIRQIFRSIRLMLDKYHHGLAAFLNAASSVYTIDSIPKMKIFLSLVLWCILLVICWPIALIALFLFPLVWLLLLPFKIVGLTIDLVFKFVSAILLFPFRILSKH